MLEEEAIMKRLLPLVLVLLATACVRDNRVDTTDPGNPGGGGNGGNGGGNSGATTILVDDKAAPEGADGNGGVLSFDIRLDQASDLPVTVSWRTVDGTALAGEDYEEANGEVSFAADETLKSVAITLIGDDVDEAAETLMLELSNPTGAELGDASAEGTIANDDGGCDADLPGSENPWLVDERVLINYSHRGGALEYPENTMYSYKKSVEIGADVLEMDVYETGDGELVVIHDETVDRTTNSTGSVSNYTVAELKAMDAAYWFINDRGAVTDGEEADYEFRGVATGEKAPPKGYLANDFTIPTLEEILQAFPNTLINIELKPDPDSTGSYETKVADLLKAYGRKDDVIVASFIDVPAALFKLQAPCVSTSVPTGQAAVYVLTSQGPLPMTPVIGHHAFQVPPELGIEVVTEDFVNDAHNQNVAVHVWTINSCDEMVRLLNLGVDAVMTDRPGLLEDVLAQTPGSWSCEGLE